jgi:hypothetical protein
MRSSGRQAKSSWHLAIRQLCGSFGSTRALDAFLDQSVGLSADFLEDIDYLARSPDIPESERALFAQDWPEERAAVAAQS